VDLRFLIPIVGSWSGLNHRPLDLAKSSAAGPGSASVWPSSASSSLRSSLRSDLHGPAQRVGGLDLRRLRSVAIAHDVSRPSGRSFPFVRGSLGGVSAIRIASNRIESIGRVDLEGRHGQPDGSKAAARAASSRTRVRRRVAVSQRRTVAASAGVDPLQRDYGVAMATGRCGPGSDRGAGSARRPDPFWRPARRRARTLALTQRRRRCRLRRRACGARRRLLSRRVVRQCVDEPS